MDSYQGRVFQVDLAHGAVATDSLNMKWAETYVGAEGLLSSHASLSAQRTRNGEEHVHARGVPMTAGNAPDGQAIDTIWTDVAEFEGLDEECLRMRGSGHSRKLAIHPCQTEVIESALPPTADEAEYARHVLDAFIAGGGKAIRVDDEMVDVPLAARARQLVAAAERAPAVAAELDV